MNIGIIGIGNMGFAHLNCLLGGEISGFTAAAVCDIDESRLELAKNACPSLYAFSSYKELILSGTVGAVIVATPHPLHAEISVFALEHGIHVLSEKPVDVSVSAALAVNAAAKKSGKHFAVMFNQRTNSHFKKARELMKSGALGELKSARWIITNWYRTQAYYDSGSWRGTWTGEGGGVLMNQAPHNLDLFQWICGMPKAVTGFVGFGKYHNIETDDDATLFFEYENGATGIFAISTGEYPGTNRLEINGTGGRIVIENGVLKLWRFKTDEKVVRFESESGFVDIPYDYSETKEYSETGHRGILQNFADAILKGDRLIAPGVEGINQLSLANAAYLSQAKGNAKVALPLDPDEYDLFLAKARSGEEPGKGAKPETLAGEYNERWKVRF